VSLIVQTFVVTVEMHADPLLYYSNIDEYEYHLKYTALDPQCILAFLPELKNSRSWGKYYGVSHMSKFYDAIKWGSILANQFLFTNLYSKPHRFHAAYKRDFQKIRKRYVDERG